VGIFEDLILKISSDAFFRVFGRDTFFGSPQSLTWPALDLRRGLRRVLNHSEGSAVQNCIIVLGSLLTN
jgi:hypothetical protein